MSTTSTGISTKAFEKFNDKLLKLHKAGADEAKADAKKDGKDITNLAEDKFERYVAKHLEKTMGKEFAGVESVLSRTLAQKDAKSDKSVGLSPADQTSLKSYDETGNLLTFAGNMKNSIKADKAKMESAKDPEKAKLKKLIAKKEALLKATYTRIIRLDVTAALKGAKKIAKTYADVAKARGSGTTDANLFRIKRGTEKDLRLLLNTEEKMAKPTASVIIMMFKKQKGVTSEFMGNKSLLMGDLTEKINKMSDEELAKQILETIPERMKQIPKASIKENLTKDVLYRWGFEAK